MHQSHLLLFERWHKQEPKICAKENSRYHIWLTYPQLWDFPIVHDHDFLLWHQIFTAINYLAIQKRLRLAILNPNLKDSSFEVRLIKGVDAIAIGKSIDEIGIAALDAYIQYLEINHQSHH
jgi:hypothetical protein